MAKSPLQCGSQVAVQPFQPAHLCTEFKEHVRLKDEPDAQDPLSTLTEEEHEILLKVDVDPDKRLTEDQQLLVRQMLARHTLQTN